jgi:hypothetical protein
VIRNGQVGIQRAERETIDIFGQYADRQSDGMPFEIAARVAVGRTNNFRTSTPHARRDPHRTIGEHAAIHVEPFWAGNTDLGSDLGDDSTTMLGLGCAGGCSIPFMSRPSSRRDSAATPDTHGASVAIEARRRPSSS